MRRLTQLALLAAASWCATEGVALARDRYWGWHNRVWGKGWDDAMQVAAEWRAAGLDMGTYPIDADGDPAPT